jgi:Flp pilus assembly pilin Flp
MSNELINDCSGQALVEYSFILLLVALACFVVLGFLGDAVAAAFNLIVQGFPSS